MKSMILMYVSGISVMDSVVRIVIIFGGIPSIYTESNKIIGSLQTWAQPCNKWERTFISICHPFKFAFLDGKFVNKLTPFVSLDYILWLTAQRLLLRNN